MISRYVSKTWRWALLLAVMLLAGWVLAASSAQAAPELEQQTGVLKSLPGLPPGLMVSKPAGANDQVREKTGTAYGGRASWNVVISPNVGADDDYSGTAP